MKWFVKVIKYLEFEPEITLWFPEFHIRKSFICCFETESQVM